MADINLSNKFKAMKTAIIRYPFLLIILVLVLGMVACEDQQEEEDIDNEPFHERVIDKSLKRGLSYNLTDSADFEALKSGVSWWYNWYITSSAPAGYFENYELEFIPMIWGNNSGNNNTILINFILEHPEIDYLLVLNEPNLTDQANLSPSQAAEEWLTYESVINDLADQGREIKLVGPAMNWGTMPGYSDPITWMDAFLEAFQSQNNRAPIIDYLAFHWYDYGLQAQLDRLQKYGKQIWITEMANWNSNIDSYTEQIQQMYEMVTLCESRDDVFRYAWFIGRGGYPDSKFTYLFEESPGALTDLGEVYLSIPFSN